MNHHSILRTIPALLVLAAASFGFQAHAEGEGYPKSDVNTRANPAPTPEVVQKIENSRAGKATGRGVKKATRATKKAGRKTASAIRNTGNKISEKLPESKTPVTAEQPKTAP